MKNPFVKSNPEAKSLPPIPPLIMKNTIFFALAQALQGVGMQLAVTFSAIMVIRILGNASLAGLGGGILGISRFAAAYPIGKLTDAYGRKPGMIIGLLMTLVGSLVLGLSITFLSLFLFVLGISILGLGVGAVMQLRVAAADMYPVSRRAEGLGYVLTGSVVGAFAAPFVVGFGEFFAKTSEWDAIAISWGLTPFVILPALGFVLLVKPDPQKIAMNLSEYWTGESPVVVDSSTESDHKSSGVSTILRDRNKQVAFAFYGTAQGTMAMMMVMTPLVMNSAGHSMSAISIAVSLHVFGMFGFSVLMGKLTDRIGRKPLLGVGAIVTGIGALLVPATTEYWIITLGLFLVGLGWSGINVASTALIVDTTDPSQRGRAIGANDSVASIIAVITPLLGGVIVELFGLMMVGIVGCIIALIPLIIYSRLSEISPGIYKD